jgi:hypothetical protein
LTIFAGSDTSALTIRQNTRPELVIDAPKARVWRGPPFGS